MGEEYVELRPLGPLEKYSYVRSQLGIYQNVCVTTNFTRNTHEALRPALVRALASVIAKHPILSAVPVGDLMAPRFARLSSIDVVRSLVIEETVQTDEGVHEAGLIPSWDQIVQDQHNTPFKHGTTLAPFWRLYIQSNGDDDTRFLACFCFHHSLLDTQSSLVFLRDLEHALSHPSTENSSVDNVIPASMEPLSPSMESLHDFPLSPEFIAEQKVASPPPDNVWSGPPQALPVETRFCSAWISEALTNRLVVVARKEKTSVTGILMAALAQSCFSLIPLEHTEISGDCAISLRQFLPGVPDTIGCYVGAFSQKYYRSIKSFWEDARDTKRIVRDLISIGAPDVSSTYLKHVEDMEAWFGSKIGKKRSAAWEISNVGLLGPSKGDHGGGKGYQMNSLLFSQSASACAGPIKVSVATGRDGRLSLGFTWQGGVVDDDFARHYMSKVTDLITQLTESHRPADSP